MEQAGGKDLITFRWY